MNCDETAQERAVYVLNDQINGNNANCIAST